jgi:hypothetical protein
MSVQPSLMLVSKVGAYQSEAPDYNLRIYKLTRVCVPVRPFLPSLMLWVRPGAYSRGHMFPGTSHWFYP